MRPFLRAAALTAVLLPAPLLAQTTSNQTNATPATKAADSQSQQQAKSPSTLTGEWGGLRTELRDEGIDLTAGYTSEFATNISGGTRKDATETGQFSFGATVDTDKLLGLKGGTLQTTITFRRGHDLDLRAGLGTLQQVQEVYGRGQTWRLTEFWYQQQFAGGVDLKLGRLVQGGDFNSFSCNFENLSFCGAQAGNLFGDYWYNYPVAQWGARLRLKRRDWYVMAGAYENNPNNLLNNFTLSHRGATGVLVPVEAGWTPHLGPHHLPGSYRIGGWYNSSNGDDVLLDVNHRPIAITGAEPLVHSGRYGGYILLQQQLTGTYVDDPKTGPKTTHGLSVFLNFTQGDRATSTTDNQLAAGLFFTGPIPGRKDDDLGFAVARTDLNSRVAEADLLAAPGSARPRAEYESELYYSVHLRPWLIVRPNVQYVIDPGGYANVTDVVVFGIKSAVTF